MAIERSERELNSLCFRAPVTTYTDTTHFKSTALVGLDLAFADSWKVYVTSDGGGAGAAPYNEWRGISDFDNSDGTITHAAFSAALDEGDVVLIVHPLLYEPIAMRGGAETLESIDDELDAMLDIAEYATNSVTCDGTEQTLWSVTSSSFPFYFGGGFIDFTGANAGAGEETTIKMKVKVDGTNYRTVYEETFLDAAVPDPTAIPFPRSSTSQAMPDRIECKQDLIITIQQTAVGGGWNTLEYRIIDAERGS